MDSWDATLVEPTDQEFDDEPVSVAEWWDFVLESHGVAEYLRMRYGA